MSDELELVAERLGVASESLRNAVLELAGGRLAVNLSRTEKRERLRGRLHVDPGDERHGTDQGARAGCKCGKCVSRKREITMRQRRSKAARLLDVAGRRGQQWTGPELELLARDDLSTTQVAAMLGRTLYGVQNQRRRLRAGEPRQVYLAGVPRCPR